MMLLVFLSTMTCWAGKKSKTPYRITMDLSGEWRCALDTNHTSTMPSVFPFRMNLPGTTDTNHLGTPATSTIETTHLTRLYSFKGQLWVERDVEIPESWRGKHIELTLERTKVTEIFVDGKRVGGSREVIAPQTFDLTAALQPGPHKLTICVDNASGIPQQLYASSHAFSEDTQTNWNGIIGRLELNATNPCHITRIDIQPKADGTAVVLVRFAGRPKKNTQLHVFVAPEGKMLEVNRTTGFTNISTIRNGYVDMYMPIIIDDTVKNGGTLGFNLNMKQNYEQWNEFTPVVYKLTAELTDCDTLSQTFGFVSMAALEGQLYINGKPSFLRGKHDGCVFPLTGHTPMDTVAWRKYLQTCKDYGINHIRFHSWCPPEAAFAEADKLGLYLQPELPFWGDFNANDSLLMDCLLREGKAILRAYGNHPSFRMMSLGNELWGSIEAMQQFVKIFRTLAPDKLYTLGTNYYLGYKGIQPGMDYVTTCRLGGEKWGEYNTHTRGSFSFADAFDGGIINHQRPNTVFNFDAACDTASVPVISHETGQFQTYPDYSEIKKYTGVLYPYNLEVFRHRLEQAGMGDEAEAFHRASGLWSKELYKADIEADLRTRKMVGFQLLDLQDYPGQGSAFVGMLDAFMDSKGLTTPEEWRQWCSPVVPLLEMDSLCFADSDTLRARVKVANYSGLPGFNNVSMWCELKDGDQLLSSETCGLGYIKNGLTDQGEIRIPLSNLHLSQPKQLTLSVTFLGDTGSPQPGLGHNIYKVWVYPDNESLTSLKEGISIVRSLDEAEQPLKEGKSVLLLRTDTTCSVGGLFQTDYWNYRMFKTICENNKKPVSPGTLGLYIAQPQHPVFNGFPTEEHTSWQWFPVVKASRPVILDRFPTSYRPLVQVIDNVERNHRLGLLFELRVGEGKLLVCASDIDHASANVEGRAFYRSLLRYMHSADFHPSFSIGFDELRANLSGGLTETNLQRLDNITKY